MRNNDIILNEELKKITSLMSYNRSLTLNENIQEQAPGADRFVDMRAMDLAGIDYADYQKHQYGDITKVIEKWDSDTAGWVELGLTLGGILLVATGVGAPLGGAMIAAGTTVGVADAGVRFYRGDTFGGALMLALQLIPGGELVGIIKGGKSVLKVGKYSDDAVRMFDNLTDEAMVALNEKAAKNTLSKTEAEVMEMVMESAAKQESRITFRALEEAWVKLQESLYNATLEGTLLKTFPILVKLGKWGLKTVLQIGGTAISVDLLWKLISINDPELRKVRNESEFGVLLDLLYGGTFDMSPEWVKKIYLDIWRKLWNEDGTPNYSEQGEMSKLINGNITDADLKDNEDLQDAGKKESQDRLYQGGMNVLGSTPEYSKDDKEKYEKGIANVQPVKFGNLTKGLQTIRKGQKGKVVRDIQRMLVTLGYDLGTTGKTKDGVDGDFGDSTHSAIYNFQLDYDLDGIDGVVGKETSNKLYELYLEKKNGNEE